MAASVVTSTVRRFRSMASSKAARSTPSTAAGPGCPTWFHTKSSPLKRPMVSHTMRRESSSFVRSATMPWAVPPAAAISFTTRSTPAASTSTTATCAPSRAKRRAPARPMPEAAAVTIPIFPAKRMAWSSRGRCVRRFYHSTMRRSDDAARRRCPGAREHLPYTPPMSRSPGGVMTRRARSLAVVVALAVASVCAAPPTHAAPEGQLAWGVHITLVPTYFDPAETAGLVTPFMLLYALHDALVKPMPGNPAAPSLAESWTMSKDGLVYEFALRRGVKFHNGDVLTSEDVKYSFERYRGASAGLLKARVAKIETPTPERVRIVLKQPWADFMTFYASPATGASWIVPKKYVEKVGDDGFKKAPVGAGPYKFVSFKPGVELTLEAFDQYWRKVPNVKTLFFKVITEEATRLAALKRGEVDIAYSFTGSFAEELKKT